MTALATGLAAVLVASALQASPAAAAPSGAATKRTEDLIAAFKKVPAETAKPTKAERAARERQFATLDGFLDLEYLTDEAIRPSASKLKPDELARFKSRFSELIRLVAYPNSGDFFRKAELEFLPEKKVSEQVTAVPVKVVVPSEDLETEVEFHWRATGDAPPRIVDVYFEGDSLVRDYQNQIARLLAKSGTAGLFKALDDRYAELSGAPAK